VKILFIFILLFGNLSAQALSWSTHLEDQDSPVADIRDELMSGREVVVRDQSGILCDVKFSYSAKYKEVYVEHNGTLRGVKNPSCGGPRRAVTLVHCDFLTDSSCSTHPMTTPQNGCVWEERVLMIFQKTRVSYNWTANVISGRNCKASNETYEFVVESGQ
jgi:hypothetical protein